MRREDLELFLQRVPCPVVRLHLTGGRTFDLTDRDDVFVTRTTVEVLIPGEPNREAVISLLHVVWAEVISPT